MPKTKTAPPQAKAAPEPAPAPKATGIKKINLAGIAAKSDTKAKTAYPVLPDETGDVAKLVADILDETDQLEALEASLELKKAELKGLAASFYFTHHHGSHEIASSVEARSGERTTLVTFQNRYKVVPDEAPIVDLLGDDRTARYFKQAFDLKISGDKLPADKADTIIEGVIELFREHGASAALTAISGIKPVKDFHAARHTALTAEENMALQLICPVVAMVKTKGRGEAE